MHRGPQRVAHAKISIYAFCASFVVQKGGFESHPGLFLNMGSKMQWEANFFPRCTVPKPHSEHIRKHLHLQFRTPSAQWGQLLRQVLGQNECKVKRAKVNPITQIVMVLGRKLRVDCCTEDVSRYSKGTRLRERMRKPIALSPTQAVLVPGLSTENFSAFARYARVQQQMIRVTKKSARQAEDRERQWREYKRREADHERRGRGTEGTTKPGLILGVFGGGSSPPQINLGFFLPWTPPPQKKIFLLVFPLFSQFSTLFCPVSEPHQRKFRSLPIYKGDFYTVPKKFFACGASLPYFFTREKKFFSPKNSAPPPKFENPES